MFAKSRNVDAVRVHRAVPRRPTVSANRRRSRADGLFGKDSRFVVRSRELHVRVGRPIETRTHTYDDRDLVSAETARQLAELLRRASEH